MNPATPAQTTPAMRRMLLLAAILVVIIGMSAFSLPTRTGVYFSWTIGSPLTAAFLGGSYLAAFVLELLASREKLWANARVAVPAVFLFTALTLVVTLLHLDIFHFDSPHWNTVAGTWTWLFVYLLVPFILGALWLMQSRLGGGDPARAAPLPGWARAGLRMQGIVMALAGLLLLVAPTAVATAWPWPLTPLTGRAIGAWGIGIGTAVLHTAHENDWRRGRAGFAGVLVFALLQGINLARFGGEFAWSSAAGIAYLALLVSLGGKGLGGVLRARG
ncbi:MAG TPA: hypothetical protein VMN57_05905 [Anaerolineales bacterium]|nr:hypothetical protein [Anaerolineales bacterium]